MAQGRGTGSAGGSGTGPGWRLDASGTWTWDEPSVLARAGVGVGALRHGFAAEPLGVGRAWEPEPEPEPEPVSAVPAARSAEPGLASTPIFQALSRDRTRRSVLHSVPDPAPGAEGIDHRYVAPSVPEPHPGSGPLPIQDPDGTFRARRGLAEVPTVPPPPMTSEADETGDRAPESPEDELRRRAERRRRPLAEAEVAPIGGGRHAMREAQVTGGRHAMR